MNCVRPSADASLPAYSRARELGDDLDDGCGCSLQNERKTSTVDRLDLYARTPQAAGGTVPGDDCV